MEERIPYPEHKAAPVAGATWWTKRSQDRLRQRRKIPVGIARPWAYPWMST